RCRSTTPPTPEPIARSPTAPHVGVLATPGTVKSASYPIEIHKFFPDIRVHQQACPFWVPLVENNELHSPGAAYFVESDIKRLLEQSPLIDTVILACTHYPLLLPMIKRHMPPHIQVLAQGELVAYSLSDYLQRHPEVNELCTKGGTMQFFT